MAGDQEPEQQQSDFDKSSTIPRNSDISQSYRRMFQTKRPASTAGLPSTQAPYPGQGAYPAGHYPPTPMHTGAYPSTPTGTGCRDTVTIAQISCMYAQYHGGMPELFPFKLPNLNVLFSWFVKGWNHYFCCFIAGSCSSQGYYSGSSSHNASGSYSTGHGPVIVTPGVATIRRTPSSKPSARRSGSIGGTGPIPIRTPVIPVKIPTVPDMSGAVNGSRSAEEMVGGGRGAEESPDSPTFAGVEDASALPVMSWSGQASTNPPTVPLPNQLTQQLLQCEIGLEGGGEEAGEGGEGNMLVAIRKGVKLKRTHTNDRSAPRIAWWHNHMQCHVWCPIIKFVNEVKGFTNSVADRNEINRILRYYEKSLAPVLHFHSVNYHPQESLTSIVRRKHIRCKFSLIWSDGMMPRKLCKDWFVKIWVSPKVRHRLI